MTFSCTAVCAACQATATAESRAALVKSGWRFSGNSERCPACALVRSEVFEAVCIICGATQKTFRRELASLGWTRQTVDGIHIYRCPQHYRWKLPGQPQRFRGDRAPRIVGLVRAGLTISEAARATGCTRQNADQTIDRYAPELKGLKRERREERARTKIIRDKDGRIVGFKTAMLQAFFSHGYMRCTGGCGKILPLGEFHQAARIPYGERTDTGSIPCRVCRTCGNKRQNQRNKRLRAEGIPLPRTNPESQKAATQRYQAKRRRRVLYARLYALIIEAGRRNEEIQSRSGLNLWKSTAPLRTLNAAQ